MMLAVSLVGCMVYRSRCGCPLQKGLVLSCLAWLAAVALLSHPWDKCCAWALLQALLVGVTGTQSFVREAQLLKRMLHFPRFPTSHLLQPSWDRGSEGDFPTPPWVFPRCKASTSPSPSPSRPVLRLGSTHWCCQDESSCACSLSV